MFRLLTSGRDVPSLEENFLRKSKKSLKEREMVLANLCVDGPDINDDDPAVREKHYQDALTWLKAADFLEAKTIRFNSAGKGPAFTDEQFDLVVKRFKEYAQFAYDHGFKAGPENHWGPEQVPENMKRICEAVDHPGFGMLRLQRHERCAWLLGDAYACPGIYENHLEETLRCSQMGYHGYYSVDITQQRQYFMVS
jgi:sugar phosphate isomerase/epimerase